MPWVGVGKAVGRDRFVVFLENYFIVKEVFEVTIATKHGDVDFLVAEVSGNTEGAARLLAKELGQPGLETGRHLVLGEPSAKIWYQGALIVFPSGEEETVPILINDTFLGITMPTERLRGFSGGLMVVGKVYKLPLSIESLKEIYRLGGAKALRKVEKAASVYGLDKILDKDAIEVLRSEKREEKEADKEKVDVDFETGFVIIMRGNKLTTVPLPRYIIQLVLEGNMSKALDIYSKMSAQQREEVSSVLVSEYDVLKDIEPLKASYLKKFMEHVMK